MHRLLFAWRKTYAGSALQLHIRAGHRGAFICQIELYNLGAFPGAGVGNIAGDDDFLIRRDFARTDLQIRIFKRRIGQAVAESIPRMM